MTPEERARHFEGDDWLDSPSMPAGAPVPADDDASDLRFSAIFLGAAVVILTVGILVTVVMR